MGMPIKEKSLHRCAWCGTEMQRKRYKNGDLEAWTNYEKRKYCDRSCMAAAFDSRESKSTNWVTCHYHARKLKPDGPCERCGSTRSVLVHHRDGDYTNNKIENLERLCKSCHEKEHSKKATCAICGDKAKGLHLCNKHLVRYRKHGNPLYVNGKIEEVESGVIERWVSLLEG